MPNRTIAAMAEQDVVWYCQFKFSHCTITQLAKAYAQTQPKHTGTYTYRNRVQVGIDRAAAALYLPGRSLKGKKFSTKYHYPTKTNR